MEFPFRRDQICGKLETASFGDFDIYLKSFKKDPQRWYLCFHNVDIHEDVWNDVRGDNFPRCGFRFFPERSNEIMLLGMLLPDRLKGQNLSLEFIKALNILAYEIRTCFQKTAIIRKPTIARKLQDWGFTPDSLEGEAELLPKVKNDDATPFISFKNPCQAEDIPFYRVVKGPDLNRFPKTNSERSKIFLNTRFNKPHDFDCREVTVGFKNDIASVFNF